MSTSVTDLNEESERIPQPLSREQIKAMPAGRTMDIAIAVALFGFRREDAELEPGGYLRFSLTKDGVVYKFRAQRDAGVFEESWPAKGERLPDYSTDIAAAWEVVEKLHAEKVEFGVFNYNGNPWCCSLQAGRKYEEPEAETAPLAICRAALLLALEEKP